MLETHWEAFASASKHFCPSLAVHGHFEIGSQSPLPHPLLGLWAARGQSTALSQSQPDVIDGFGIAPPWV